MPQAYSDDLRRKLLEAYVAGEGTLEELAERFCVSESWAKKISANYRRTEKMERPSGAKPGRVSRITPEIEAFLQQAVNEKRDSTLEELQTRLEMDKGLKISIGWLWLVLDRLKFSFKKKLCTPASETSTECKECEASSSPKLRRSPPQT